ncbi:hypothetical protein NEISUBOT_04462 [Neisseria subflava NJ9703]|uniref:Uncharacterized protein n=1 Tax=Neisseria subflava NJ9703 TaxID=546268 RepID=A0A9W5MZA7_NEISU|nr:hypothetical protein NEISUBOT_04462 [Neisseria subflava NJ9703]
MLKKSGLTKLNLFYLKAVTKQRPSETHFQTAFIMNNTILRGH